MSQIAAAVEILRRGGLVAFPTETVYGLGADATSAAAVARIFAAKGRPATNPLIVHVADAARAQRYAAAWPDAAARLAERFWPGPLTLVVPRGEQIVPEATAHRPTVGLRAPDHPLALDLLRAFDGPIAAPSANRYMQVSPTTAQHVREELGSAVDLVLDGGACRVGIESTVLDLSGPRPIILRPGGLTRSQIEAVIGPVEVFTGQVSADEAAASPGLHARHYSPRAAALRFEASHRARVAGWCRANADAAWAVLVIGPADDALRAAVAAAGHGPGDLIEMPATAPDYAHRLYATLRRLDRRGVQTLWIEMPPEDPAWMAVRDRLGRATVEP